MLLLNEPGTPRYRSTKHKCRLAASSSDAHEVIPSDTMDVPGGQRRQHHNGGDSAAAEPTTKSMAQCMQKDGDVHANGEPREQCYRLPNIVSQVLSQGKARFVSSYHSRRRAW